jgi:hypothetical protein
MKRAVLAGFLALATSALAGCRPFIMPVTSAPIDHEGSVDGVVFQGANDTVHLSKGVAIAVECRDEAWYTPCSNATARTGNVAIARVVPAHLEKYRSPWGTTEWVDADSSHRSAFVVMGVEAGETDLFFDTEEGNRHFHLIVDP